MSSLVRTIPLALVLSCSFAVSGAEMPRLVNKDGRYAFLVDGQPFLILGAQINNSSSWPAILPEVWPAIEAIHANTVEAPVYWEQMEPQRLCFDFANVDELVRTGACAPCLSDPALVRHRARYNRLFHVASDGLYRKGLKFKQQ